jgi:hypothetical protein
MNGHLLEPWHDGTGVRFVNLRQASVGGNRISSAVVRGLPKLYSIIARSVYNVFKRL